MPTESFLNLYESKVIYFRKHHGTAGAIAYKLILVLASVVRLAVSPLALLEKHDRRQHHLSLAARYSRLLIKVPGL